MPGWETRACGSEIPCRLCSRSSMLAGSAVSRGVSRESCSQLGGVGAPAWSSVPASPLLSFWCSRWHPWSFPHRLSTFHFYDKNVLWLH